MLLRRRQIWGDTNIGTVLDIMTYLINHVLLLSFSLTGFALVFIASGTRFG
jgi:hypothetical protein